jgi:hypothetical protein
LGLLAASPIATIQRHRFDVTETALDHEAPEQKTYADETTERIRLMAESYLIVPVD